MNPLVSIVVPTHDNEATVVRTLNSLVEQTLYDIEIIVVDDGSTDNTVSLCRDAQRLDSRIVLVPLGENRTVLQARRIGVQQATGDYVMFCDGDDELARQAAEEASSFALGGGYEVVHFGTRIVSSTGSKHAAWERALDPFGEELFGEDILLSSAFGQPGARINGHIWNKLYERRLVERAWEPVSRSLRLPRAQDVYQTLLILAKAERYGGLSSPLYRYNFRAGKSGNILSRDSFQHFLASAHTYRAVEEHLASDCWDPPSRLDGEGMLRRLREQFIDNQLQYWFRLPRPADAALGDLLQTWGAEPVLEILAEKHADKARLIVESFSRLDSTVLGLKQPPIASSECQRIALLGNISGSGGVQKVMAVQAELLTRAGHSVTILSFDHAPEDRKHQFPPNVAHRAIGPRGDVGSGVTRLMQCIDDGEFTILLNHDNYSPLFPWTAAVTRSLGVASALFLHSFSLRALHDFREVFGYLPEIAQAYNMTVTLSEADRMWWEASQVSTVRALPNFGPASRGVAETAAATTPSSKRTHTTQPTRHSVDLLWVGRLQDGTKNVSGLLEAFAQIVTKRPDTTLAIVGGEQSPGERARLEQLAERLGVHEKVTFTGPAQDVEAWYSSAKVFLATASIEGFNLTLLEAQNFGLPVVMYDLPYLETVSGNPGVISVKWGVSERLAEAVVELLEDPERARNVGAAGRSFSQRFSLATYEAGLRSIVRELAEGHCSPPSSTVDSATDATTATVPVAVMSELYRLYERMHRSTASELRSAKRESAHLRKSLTQLKKSLADSKAQHEKVEDAITQIEKNKPVTHRKKREQPASAPSAVGGVWPLWSREGVQPFDRPSSPPFDDVPLTDSIAIPVAWALDCGALDTPRTLRFNGHNVVTRSEFISMLHKLAGSPNATVERAIYRDLDPSDAAAAWAIRREILKPSRSKKATADLPAWNPDAPLRRRSAAMILYRAAGSPPYSEPHISPYADLTVGQKSYREMCWVAHQGILPATRQKDTIIFDDQHLMTRADIVTALFRQMVGPVAKSNHE